MLIDGRVRNINMVISLPFGQSVFSGNADNVIPVMRMVILLPCVQSIFNGNADNVIPLLYMAHSARML